MLGFEMAYIPVGQYYLASAQQVICEEHRGKLTEVKPKPPVVAHAFMGQGGETPPPVAESALLAQSETVEPMAVHFPHDSFIPYHRDDVKRDLKKYIGKKVSITGYASSEGGQGYNKRLSKKRADRIARIAKKVGVEVESIDAVGESQCRAKTSRQYPKCRKVDILPAADGGKP